ncbi:MAG: hypothetical protein ABI238_07560 [Terrimesophilobacter sp.]
MVNLPRWDALPGDAERCLADIDNWADILRNSGLVAAFSVRAAAAMGELEGERLLDALDSFAAANWDFRGGRERNLASPPVLTAAEAAALDTVAAPLGLDGTSSPRRDRFDAVVMTGGMVRAGIVKPRFLRELHDSGLRWREGVFLGGFRPFAGDEVDVARALGVVGDNEFDAMTFGMREAFGLGPPDSVEPVDTPLPAAAGRADWRRDSWDWSGHALQVVAAPSSDPARRRANTADTFRFWASHATGVGSVLVITTPVYVPYQGAAAIEVFGLEFGMAVETAAVSASASDLGAHSQEFLPQHRAQELRSAIHGMRTLRTKLSKAG